MKRAMLLTAAAGTVLAIAAMTLRLRRSTHLDTGPTDADRWGALPCPPLRDGVGHLHDWLAFGDWTSPTDVLEALQEQAPAHLLADLLGDLAVDLRAADHPGTAARAHEAEQLLRHAAELLGEVDYSHTRDDPHTSDCPGGCGGTGATMVTMTWEDQGDGIYVPVHQEPTDCPADRHTEPVPHSDDCECSGTGFTFGGGYRHLCLASWQPTPDLPPDDDPWSSAPPHRPADDRPF